MIARIGEAGEAKKPAAEAGRRAEAARRQPGEEPPKPEPRGRRRQPRPARPRRATAAPAAADGDGRVKASPVARRMARDLGVELARLEGSGPGGRIVKADVRGRRRSGAGAERSARGSPRRAPSGRPSRSAARPAPRARPRSTSSTRLQQTVARRMAESKATAPDFSLSLDVDMTEAVELRERLKEVARPGAVVQRHGRQGRRHSRCASTRA